MVYSRLHSCIPQYFSVFNGGNRGKGQTELEEIRRITEGYKGLSGEGLGSGDK